MRLITLVLATLITLPLRAELSAEPAAELSAELSVELPAEQVLLGSPDLNMYLGDSGNWRLPVSDLPAESDKKKVRVERDEEGFYTLNWKGRGEGQFYVSSNGPSDLTAMNDSNAALVMQLRINQPPKRQVVMRMGCGYPCEASADVTKLMKALPKGEWLRVSLDLSCFADRGLDVTRVDTPFLMLTSGKFSLSIADARLVPGVGESATIKCS